jgi:hypothetical protein
MFDGPEVLKTQPFAAARRVPREGFGLPIQPIQGEKTRIAMRPVTMRHGERYHSREGREFGIQQHREGTGN